MKYLMDKFKVESLADMVKEKHRLKKGRVYPLPEDEAWKIPFIKELALHQKGQLDIDFGTTELEEILGLICTD